MARSYGMKVLAGTLVGALFGLFLAVMAGLNYAFGGSAKGQFGSVWGLTATFLGGGTLVGTIAGVLHPLARRRWAVLFLGPIAAFPLMLAVGISRSGPVGGWERGNWVAVLLTSVLFGGGVGYALYPRLADDWGPPDE